MHASLVHSLLGFRSPMKYAAGTAVPAAQPCSRGLFLSLVWLGGRPGALDLAQGVGLRAWLVRTRLSFLKGHRMEFQTFPRGFHCSTGSPGCGAACLAGEGVPACHSPWCEAACLADEGMPDLPLQLM
eukprot:1160884-Pelagomonas_calceolata.AAC.3